MSVDKKNRHIWKFKYAGYPILLWHLQNNQHYLPSWIFFILVYIDNLCRKICCFKTITRSWSVLAVKDDPSQLAEILKQLNSTFTLKKAFIIIYIQIKHSKQSITWIYFTVSFSLSYFVFQSSEICRKWLIFCCFRVFSSVKRWRSKSSKPFDIFKTYMCGY